MGVLGEIGKAAEHISRRVLPEGVQISSAATKSGRSINAYAHTAGEEPLSYMKSGLAKYGYAGGSASEEVADTFHLALTEVPHEMRGKGVGSALLERLAEEAHGAGFKYMTGEIRNPTAMSNRLKLFGEGNTTWWDEEAQQAGAVISRPASGAVKDTGYVRTDLNAWMAGRSSSAREGLRTHSSAPARFASRTTPATVDNFRQIPGPR